VAALFACAEEGVAFSRYLVTSDEQGVQHVWRTEFSACRDDVHGGEETYAVMATARDVTGYAESVLRAERDKQRLTMALELDDLLVREYDLRTREMHFFGDSPELQRYCTFRTTRWRSSIPRTASAAPTSWPPARSARPRSSNSG
jgi:hypothetical protein